MLASRIAENDPKDPLLPKEDETDAGSYELSFPREMTGMETCVPAYLKVLHLRRLAALVQ